MTQAQPTWMKKIARSLLVAGLTTIVATGCATRAEPEAARVAEPADTSSLVIATWNVEHLAFPMNRGCRPRSALELLALREYAESLDADIVALQEVASQEAVEQLFPANEWRIVMSARPDSEPYECRESGRPSTQQKVAFAIRRSVPAPDIRHYDELAVGMEGLRWGLSITLETPAGPAEVLNVHLKSGCFVDDYSSSDDEDCDILAKQVQWLDEWVETRERANASWVIAGDFNHRLSAPYNRMTRQLTTNADGTASTTTIVTRKLIGCHPWYPAPIDHIVAGGEITGLLRESAAVHPFADQSTMGVDGMLSDHCAVTAQINEQSGRLSTAVRWQTVSKEREMISLATFNAATEALKERGTESEDWVVVLDIDETLLDNSAYQVWLDRTGQSYSSRTWATWVMQEEATPIPGAIDYVRAVLDLGGRVALVTNRNASLDAHTWTNLKAVGFPIDAANACLLGRTPADSASVSDPRYVNDKDRRREAIREGRASCHTGDSSVWQRPHAIVMQIGDNIEDIEGVTQENAVPAELIDRWGVDIFLLPNPMYGSW